MPVGGAEDLVLSLMRLQGGETQTVAVCLRELGTGGMEAVEQGLPVTLLCAAPRRQVNPFGILRLSRWLRATGAEVVHTHVYNAHVYGVLAARLAGVPVMMHHHKTFNRARRRRWLVTHCLAKLAAVQLTLSDQTRADVSAALHIPLERVFSLPNAVDESVFRPAMDRVATRHSLGLPENGLLIGGVASLTPQKNHSATVRMCAEVSRGGLRFQCVICGEGMMRAKLEQEIAASNLRDCVRLVGNQRPIHPWLQSFDVLLLPSTWEGQPLILLQAMACGVPIIASRIEGNVATLGAQHPGLFDLERTSDYAELVRRVGHDADFRRALLEHQRRVFAAQPTLADYAARLDSVYRSAVSIRSKQ